MKERAEQGDADAQYQMGVYRFKQSTFPMLAPDVKIWFQRAAKQGNAPAMYSLAKLAARNHSKDQVAINALYVTAAKRGYAVAQCTVANRYEIGEYVPRDLSQARFWYQQAADQGNAEAQMYLGYMDMIGRGGPKNDIEAGKWYRKAIESYRKLAEQNNANAQGILAIIYDVGLGTPKDAAVAKSWYAKSVATLRNSPDRGDWIRRSLDHEEASRRNLLYKLYQRYSGQLSIGPLE